MNLLEQFAREAQQRAYEAALLAEQRASERFLAALGNQQGNRKEDDADREHGPSGHGRHQRQDGEDQGEDDED